jgi:hypothetical protein
VAGFGITDFEAFFALFTSRNFHVWKQKEHKKKLFL